MSMDDGSTHPKSNGTEPKSDTPTLSNGFKGGKINHDESKYATLQSAFSLVPPFLYYFSISPDNKIPSSPKEFDFAFSSGCCWIAGILKFAIGDGKRPEISIRHMLQAKRFGVRVARTSRRLRHQRRRLRSRSRSLPL